jgi:ABC-type transport system involved in Fe-S cluster assembly fused permease/ATPase subunit
MRCIVRADKIVVMDRGRIVQEGAHGDLLQIADALYARL